MPHAPTHARSFWIDDPSFQENDFFEIVRDTVGDSVENVTKLSEFTHPKTQRHSKLFRIVFRSLERTLTNEEVNAWNDKVRQRLAAKSGIELR